MSLLVGVHAKVGIVVIIGDLSLSSRDKTTRQWRRREDLNSVSPKECVWVIPHAYLHPSMVATTPTLHVYTWPGNYPCSGWWLFGCLLWSRIADLNSDAHRPTGIYSRTNIHVSVTKSSKRKLLAVPEENNIVYTGTEGTIFFRKIKHHVLGQ